MMAQGFDMEAGGGSVKTRSRGLSAASALPLLAMIWTTGMAGDVPLYEAKPLAVFRMVIAESSEPLMSQGDLVPEAVFEKRLADWQKTGRAKVMLDSGFLVPLISGDDAPWLRPPQIRGGDLHRAINSDAKTPADGGAVDPTQTAQQPGIEVRQAGPALTIRGQKDGDDLKLEARAAVWEAEDLPLVQAMEATTALIQAMEAPTGKRVMQEIKAVRSTATAHKWTSPLGSCVALCVTSGTKSAKHLTLFLLPVSQRPALVADEKNPVTYARGTAQVIKGRVPADTFWRVMRSVRPDVATGKIDGTQVLEMAWNKEKIHTFQQVMEKAGGTWAAPVQLDVRTQLPPPYQTDGTEVTLLFASVPRSHLLRVVGSSQISHLDRSWNNGRLRLNSVEKELAAEALQQRWNLVVTTTENEVQVAAFCLQLEEPQRAGQ